AAWWPYAAAAAVLALLALTTTSLWDTTRPPPGGGGAAAPQMPPPFAAAPARNAEPSQPVAAEAAARLPAVAAATEAKLTLHDLLARPELDTHIDDAIGQLLTLWGATYDSARGEPCVQATEQGLRCSFQTRATLGELRRINWPTIVSLTADDGAEYPLLLASLGYDDAEAIVRGATFKVPLGE